jgi:hypothetical protein
MGPRRRNVRSGNHHWPAVATVCILLVASAPAAERTVTVTGEGAVINGDVAGARDLAITDARTRALEQAAGVFLDAETVHHKELFLASGLQIRARGAILRERILEESEDPDSMYRVKMEAVVSEDRLADELVRLVEDDRIVVAATLRGETGDLDAAHLQGLLAGYFTDRGFRRVIEAPDAFPGGLNEAVRLGIRHLSDAVTAVEAEIFAPEHPGGGLWTVRAYGQARLFRVRSRETLAAVSVAEGRGFGPDAAAARKHAMKNLAEKLGAELGARLLPDEYRQVRVEITGIPDFASFERTRNLLLAMRWVQEVEIDPVGYHRRRTVFLVRTRQDPVNLGAAIDRETDLEVQEAGARGITARFLR